MATCHRLGISDHSLRDTSAVVLGVEAREGPTLTTEIRISLCCIATSSRTRWPRRIHQYCWRGYPWKSRPLSLGGETRAHWVGHGGLREPEHSRQKVSVSRRPGMLERRLANQPATVQLWKKYSADSTTSVFTTVGDAGTPWHPQFFRAVYFESERWTEDGLRHIFGPGSLLNQHFCSHHSYSSHALAEYPGASSLGGREGIPT